mgnify:CR=1 FL=1
MNHIIFSPVRRVITTIFLLIGILFLNAQSYTLDNTTSFLQVDGTSSLHDWHVDAEKQSGYIEFSDFDKVAINSIKLSVESESLKSGKSGMDKNTYKALKTKSFKNIDFNLIMVESIAKVSEGIYNVKGKGKMLICGVSQIIPLDFELIIKDKVISIIGKNTILMTDYGIKPPTALLGTIKTGNEIVITHKTVFKQ